MIDRDTYSYLTAGRVWINHEWLAEIIFAAVYALGHSPALILLKTSLALLTLGLVYWHLGRRGLSVVRGGIVLMLVVVLVTTGARPVRPHIFTYLLFVVTLLLLDQADRGRHRWLWGIPIVFALWVNLHGGFLVGMGIVIVWSFTRIAVALYRGHRGRSRISPHDIAFAAGAIGAGMATLLNPYGFRLLQFLARLATIERPEIIEWQPMKIMSAYGAVYLVFLAMGVLGYLRSRTERRPGPLAVFCCVALFPLLGLRHGSLFALALPIVAGEHIGDVWNRWLPGASAGSKGRAAAWVQRCIAAVSIAGGISLISLSLPNIKCVRIDPPFGFSAPARAVSVLQKSGASGDLAIFFDWGEYGIWHLAPRIKVSIDGRRETIYSDEVLGEHLNWLLGFGDWDKLIRDHNTDMALVRKTFPVFNLLKLAPGWVLAYEDSVSAIFAKHGSPLIHQVRGVSPDPLPDDGAGLCFP